MSNQLLIILRTRRSELAAITPDVGTWPSIKEWHAKARPAIAKHFPEELDAFDSNIRIRWERSFKTVSPAGRSRAKGAERSANNRRVANAHAKLLAHLDALIELHDIDEVDSGTQETDSVFADIDRLTAGSLLPQQFRTIICNDIAEAQRAYRAGAYKGSVVMLGAALEGMMLGTLQRSDVITHLATSGNAPGPIRAIGTRNPALMDKIGNDLSFEDYKVCIHELIPGSNALGVDNIQSFRNAIHPWKTIQEPLKYGDFDQPRALHYVGSLHKIAEALHQWQP